MKSAEQIAREAAERLLEFDGWNHDKENQTFTKVAGKLIHTFNVGPKTVEELRGGINQIILAAIEDDRQQPPPVESPVSVERLRQIYTLMNNRQGMSLLAWEELQRHIAHLERLVRWLMHEHSREDAEALLAQARQAGSDEAMAKVRELVIEMRRYIIHHGLLLGECVAWDRLKDMTGVKHDFP